MDEYYWELKIIGGEGGSDALYFFRSKPTAWHCEYRRAKNNGDSYTLTRKRTPDGGIAHYDTTEPAHA